MSSNAAASYIPGISPELIQEAEEIKKQQQKEDAQVLQEIGEDFSLFSWGYSEPLKITRAGKAEWKKFILKSVGISEIMESYQERMPSPPATRELVKKDSTEGRELGYKHDTFIMRVNEADSGYLDMKRRHETAASQEILLRGLAYDLKYKGQLVLRGADINSPSEIIDRDGAMARLRQMGLTAEHFGALVRGIRELTADAEVQEEKN